MQDDPDDELYLEILDFIHFHNKDVMVKCIAEDIAEAGEPCERSAYGLSFLCVKEVMPENSFCPDKGYNYFSDFKAEDIYKVAMCLQGLARNAERIITLAGYVKGERADVLRAKIQFQAAMIKSSIEDLGEMGHVITPSGIEDLKIEIREFIRNKTQVNQHQALEISL